MIYFYNIKIIYYKNDIKILKEYKNISFAEIFSFLNNIQKKHSYFTIYSILPNNYYKWRL